jgi:hypothetical protein
LITGRFGPAPPSCDRVHDHSVRVGLWAVAIARPAIRGWCGDAIEGCCAIRGGFAIRGWCGDAIGGWCGDAIGGCCAIRGWPCAIRGWCAIRSWSCAIRSGCAIRGWCGDAIGGWCAIRGRCVIRGWCGDAIGGWCAIRGGFGWCGDAIGGWCAIRSWWFAIRGWCAIRVWCGDAISGLDRRFELVGRGRLPEIRPSSSGSNSRSSNRAAVFAPMDSPAHPSDARCRKGPSYPGLSRLQRE